jgi:GNAT superfamily N-acetyltransferase
VNAPVVVRELMTLGPREIASLSDVLIDCVDGGASVNFLLPMTRAKADAFWQGVAEGLARGDRRLLVAQDASGRLIGTAQVLLRVPENQPHRGELAKMLVHRSARRRGVGARLLRAAEAAAAVSGKTLLVLDTASDDAERLYAREGWQRCGTIPGYALFPDGRYCETVIFYKSLVPASSPASGSASWPAATDSA